MVSLWITLLLTLMLQNSTGYTHVFGVKLVSDFNGYEL